MSENVKKSEPQDVRTLAADVMTTAATTDESVAAKRQETAVRKITARGGSETTEARPGVAPSMSDVVFPTHGMRVQETRFPTGIKKQVS